MAEKAIERFDFDGTHCCCVAKRVVRPDGEYVYHSDIAELERDARRYRRLREHHIDYADGGDGFVYMGMEWRAGESGYVPETVDAAIDAALSRADGGGA